MAEGNGETKGRAAYAYIVLAYDQPPFEPGQEISEREDLKLIGVFEAATHEEAAERAAGQFPPRVGERRTFVATLASKWREFDYGAETKIEVTGFENVQTHPANIGRGGYAVDPEAEQVEAEPPTQAPVDEVGTDDGDPLPGEGNGADEDPGHPPAVQG